jgi:hypothetical protein
MAETNGLRVNVRTDATRENVVEVVLEHVNAEGGVRLIDRLNAYPADPWHKKQAIEDGRFRAGLGGWDFVIEG